MSDIARQPAGTPAGGQFAASVGAAPDIELVGAEDWKTEAWNEQGFDVSAASAWSDGEHEYSAAEARRLVDAGLTADEALRYARVGIRNVNAVIAWNEHFGDPLGARREIEEGSPGPRRDNSEYPAGERRPVSHLSDLGSSSRLDPPGSAPVTARRWDGRKVHVRSYVQRGFPSFDVDMLSDTEVRSIRDRVRAAILNAGYKWPNGRITITTKTMGKDHMRDVLDSRCDLAIAVAVLRASGQVDDQRQFGEEFWGELGLDGSVSDIER